MVIQLHGGDEARDFGCMLKEVRLGEFYPHLAKTADTSDGWVSEVVVGTGFSTSWIKD